jgi:50S ribosomal protein L16 3-hydroxylase
MTEFFDTGMTQQEFLDQYWQKKPLVIRQAFPDFKSVISPNELAGLAGEPRIESRLVIEKGVGGSWQLIDGPFSDKDFSVLPKSHWTLLVQDIDKHVPETRGILMPFSFIPNWRFDDLMVSFAPKQGSVGAHTDGYDVFLLQGMGKRKWQVSAGPLHKPALLENVDIQVLADFEPEQEWLLEPGDILYLPPHYGHHGVAMEDCMTFSIGFRAPNQSETLDAVINDLVEHSMAKRHYQDSDLQAARHGYEIGLEAVLRLKKLLHETIEEAEPLLLATFGKLVTETKPSLVSLAEEVYADKPSVKMLVEQFETGYVLFRNPYLRFAWEYHEECGTIYMGGESYPLTFCQKKNIIILAEQAVITSTDWQMLSNDIKVVNLLRSLVAEGGFYWVKA